MRVQADLGATNAASEMWGEQFEGDDSQFLQIENELVQKLSQQLRLGSNAAPVRMASRPATSNSEACRLYLRGRFALSRSTVPDTQKAIGFFQQALPLDPTFALAHSGLADCYIGLSNSYLTPIEAMAKAKAAALRAIESDPSLPEAHLSLGVIKGWFDFDWRAADAEFTDVIRSQPNGAFGHFWRGWVLFTRGHGHAAVRTV